MVFVIHWHESAMDLHVFPSPIPAPTSLSIRFLWVFPVHQVRALVSCIQPGLVISFTLDNIHVSSCSLKTSYWKDWCWSSNTLATRCEELTDSLEKTLMLGQIEAKRKGQQRMRWLDSTTDSNDMSLSKLWEIKKDREAWLAPVHRVSKSQTWLNYWKRTVYSLYVVKLHCISTVPINNCYEKKKKDCLHFPTVGSFIFWWDHE